MSRQSLIFLSLIALLPGGLLLSSPSFAEDAPSKPELRQVEPESRKVDAEQGSSSSEPVIGESSTLILPLETWVERKTDKVIEKNTPDATNDERDEEAMAILQSQELEIEEERELFRELLKRYKRENKVEVPEIAPLTKRIILKKAERRRLNRAEKYQRSRILKDQRYLAELRQKLGRGYPEIRICSVNADNYGERDVVKRLVRGRAKRIIRRKEKELLQLVISSKCSVLALQGLVGRKYEGARQAAKHFVELLNEQGPVSWTPYVAPSNNKLGYNAFFVSDAGVRVLTTKSYLKHELKSFMPFREKEFSRGPYELVLEVEGREDGRWRKVVLLTMHFRKSLNTDTEEDERWRMQMAETLREIVLSRQRDFASDPESPIFVILGDRGSGKFSPSSLILEGRYRLTDFRRRGPCELVDKEIELKDKAKKGEKKKSRKRTKTKVLTLAKCKEQPRHPKILFGLISDRLEPLRFKTVINEAGEKEFVRLVPSPKTKYLRRKEEKARSADIYMLQPDLKYALIDDNAPLRFTIAERKFKYGLGNSPFLGVELNW